MINPRQLVTRLRVIVERRINLDAEFVPALEARDIQREINQMLEQYIAEQQPSVKAGQGHIEPVMTSDLAAGKQKEFCDGYDTALIGVLGGLDSPKASAPNVSMVDVRNALEEFEAKVRAPLERIIHQQNEERQAINAENRLNYDKAEAVLAEAQKQIAELESLPKEWEGSGYNPQQCGRIVRLYQQAQKEIAALQGALRIHGIVYVIHGGDRNLDYWRCKLCDTNTPLTEAKEKSNARHADTCLLAAATALLEGK